MTPSGPSGPPIVRLVARPLVAYGLAIVAAAVAIACRPVLDPVLGSGHRMVALYVATLVIAWRYGLGPGLVVVAAGGVGIVGMSSLAASSPRIGGVLTADLAEYAAVCGAGAWLAASARAARARARDSAAEAEIRTCAMERSEERYRSFVQNSSEGIWRLELEEAVPVELPVDEQIARFFRFGYLAECNDAMARMYGFTHADEILGARLGALIVPSDPANQEYLRAFVGSGYRLTDAESHERDRHGEPRYFLNNLVGTVEDGRVVRAWGTQRDVTGRHRADEALRASEREVQQLLVREREARAEAERANLAKDEFLATLSHELRSPLSAALSWTYMLRRGLLDEREMARAIDTIERNTHLQVRLIDDLLDVSRIISGKLTHEPGAVDLRAVVDAAVDASRGTALARQIDLEVQPPPELPPMTGDASRLQQVVRNLLANAIKFTPAGGRVTIAWRRDDGDVEITVRDTGIGIAPDVLPYIFDRFRQADSSTTRRYGGLGLGLTIARHIVERHGGTIEAESAGEGQGTLMRVRLPLEHDVAVDGAASEAPAAGTAPPLPTLPRVHVLVVDDEADVREFLVTALVASGAQVTAAGSVAEALEQVETAPPDVVVTDLAMPDRDGYALLRRLRASVHGYIPVLALTALASAPERQRALAAGFDAHVTKPVDPAVLITSIARLVEEGASRSSKSPSPSRSQA